MAHTKYISPTFLYEEMEVVCLEKIVQVIYARLFRVRNLVFENVPHCENGFELRVDSSFFKDFSLCSLEDLFIRIRKTSWELPAEINTTLFFYKKELFL